MNAPAAAPGVDPGILAAATSAGPTGPAPAISPAAPATMWRAEALSCWQCVASLGVVYPSVKAIYTPDVLDQLADVWAPILEKHQIKFEGFMIYVAAAGATIPMAVSTVQAIKADVRAAKAAQIKPAAPAGEGAPAADEALAFGKAASGDDTDKPNAPLDPGAAVRPPAKPV
jgi:hypothetical protein